MRPAHRDNTSLVKLQLWKESAIGSKMTRKVAEKEGYRVRVQVFNVQQPKLRHTSSEVSSTHRTVG